MFPGSSDPTPYDIPVTILLIFLGMPALSATIFVLVAILSHGSTVVAGRVRHCSAVRFLELARRWALTVVQEMYGTCIPTSR